MPSATTSAALPLPTPTGDDLVFVAVLLGAFVPLVAGAWRFFHELLEEEPSRFSGGHGTAATAVALGLPLLVLSMSCQLAGMAEYVAHLSGWPVSVDRFAPTVHRLVWAVAERLPSRSWLQHSVLLWLWLGGTLQVLFEALRWVSDRRRHTEALRRTELLLAALEQRQEEEARAPRSSIRYF